MSRRGSSDIQIPCKRKQTKQKQKTLYTLLDSGLFSNIHGTQKSMDKIWFVYSLGLHLFITAVDIYKFQCLLDITVSNLNVFNSIPPEG